MSDLAIAAVTATLRSLISEAVEPDEVTTLPPDRASAAGTTRRLNLFLYHVSPNAAWRNQVIPGKVRPGESGREPLALNLHYLLTAYGDDQGDEADHRLLGVAMRTLHDKPVLDRSFIRRTVGEPSRLAASRLEQQYELVRITPASLTIEEMSKLWTTFQTQYRLSAAYEASVVLIESRQAIKSPLPVLKRGEQDRGVDVSASIPGRLEGIEYRDLRLRESPFPAARLGDTVTIRGVGLPGMNSRVLFLDPFREPTETEPDRNVLARLKPESGSNDERIFVRLDESQGQWQSGPLHVVLEKLEDNGRPNAKPRRTQPLFFGLAPTIHNETALAATTVSENGRRKLVVNCFPAIVRPRDMTPLEVSLLLTPTQGDKSVGPIPEDLSAANPPGAVVFDIHQVPHGEYRVRLRVEAVETLVMQREGTGFKFDERQVIRL